jgi:transcriptional regulator with XRE-family HTH domain
MNTKEALNKLKNAALKDESWMQEALWRQENESWLDISFAIAVKVLQTLRDKKMSQKDLADDLGLSPQYINKIVKGAENLTLETICKLENSLGISLINVPQYSVTVKVNAAFNQAVSTNFQSTVSTPIKKFSLSKKFQICNDNDPKAA